MTSPIVEKTLELKSFAFAMIDVAAGKKITRQEWNDTQIFGALVDGLLQIRIKYQFHQWIVSDGDILANDWYVVE